jgi:hypothetical protein
MSDATVEGLRTAVRAYRRASAAQERARLTLRQAILDEAAAGRGPAEITRLIDHEYTEKHVSRIILGKA